MCCVSERNNSTNSYFNREIFKNRNFYAALLVTTTAVLGISSLSSALPQIVKHFGVDDSLSGLILLMFTLPGIILSPVLGFLSDKFGRKIVLNGALFIFGLGGFGYFAKDFGMLLFIRFIQGIGAATLLSLNVAILGDAFEGDSLKFSLGINGVVTSISLALFPILGGILADINPKFPFLISFFSFLSLILFVVLFKEDNAQFINSKPQVKVRDVFTKNLTLIYLGTIFTFIVLYGCYLNYFSYLTTYRFNLSGALTGLIMGVASAVSAVVSFEINRITHFVKEELVYVSCFVFYTIAMVLFLLARGMSVLILGSISFGIAQGINMTVTPGLLNKFASDNLRGLTLTVNGSMTNIGQTIGPLMLGFAYRFGKLDLVFLIGTIFSICGIIATVKLISTGS